MMERTKIGKRNILYFEISTSLILWLHLPQQLSFFPTKGPALLTNSCSYCPILYLLPFNTITYQSCMDFVPKRRGSWPLNLTLNLLTIVSMSRHSYLFTYVCMTLILLCFLLSVLKAFTLCNWYAAVKVTLASLRDSVAGWNVWSKYKRTCSAVFLRTHLIITTAINILFGA